MPFGPSEHHLIVWFKRVVQMAHSIWVVHVIGPIVSANWLLKWYDWLMVRYYRIAVVPNFSWRNYRVSFRPSEHHLIVWFRRVVRTAQSIWAVHVYSSNVLVNLFAERYDRNAVIPFSS